ncbi:MAG: flippase-like domain-containing protein [Nitrosopumilus sp.]|uniref:lysylphosphatidylglycerol synthase transmembrane domain-containing protein n=1 Tax=Nitrosopumilus sp. TaxID=2024843 RepID=UPI00247E7CCB|nr:lysylphosphatidylglycerol synthase transmembrane domain-containing protein [Nitrosopumilus sp.]MCV0393507.1 flippase-like domain-containing protein [Nitrosopumilus sp.]
MFQKSFIIVLVFVLFYTAFIVYSDFDDFVKSISLFKIEYLFPVFGLFLLGKFIKSIRQFFLLKTANISISFKKNILLYMSGLSMTVTPGSSGEVIKSYFLKKKFRYDLSKSIPVFILEKFYDLTSVIIIISFTLFFIQSIEIFILISFMIIILTLVYSFTKSKSVFLFISRKLNKINFFKKYILIFDESNHLFQLLTSKKNLAQNLFFTILSMIADAIAILFIFQGFNVDLSIIFTTFVAFSSYLLGIITFLPGGIGITEISFVSLLTDKGIELSLATSIMVMSRLIGTWFLTIVGFISTKLFFK